MQNIHSSSKGLIVVLNLSILRPLRNTALCFEIMIKVYIIYHRLRRYRVSGARRHPNPRLPVGVAAIADEMLGFCRASRPSSSHCPRRCHCRRMSPTMADPDQCENQNCSITVCARTSHGVGISNQGIKNVSRFSFADPSNQRHTNIRYTKVNSAKKKVISASEDRS